jgi:lipoic acid synthetase
MNKLFFRSILRKYSGEIIDELNLKDFIKIAGKKSCSDQSTNENIQLPDWLKTKIPDSNKFLEIKSQLRSLNLNTVCEEARCPNISECWSGSTVEGKPTVATATIMLMGDECTRGCRFCSVKTSRIPKPLDPLEPSKVAEAVSQWSVGYIVLTSVDRDGKKTISLLDLEDNGAEHFAATVREIKKRKPEILIECLTGDFAGQGKYALKVAKSGLNVYAHNVETVERLTPSVRDHRAGYRQSLSILKLVKDDLSHIITKSSIMLGLGETDDEILQTLNGIPITYYSHCRFERTQG